MLRFLVLTLLIGFGCAAIASAAERRDVVFSADFDSGSLDGWQNVGNGQGGIVAIGDGRALCVTAPAKGSHMVRRALPVDAVRGLRLVMTARIKADKVEKPPQPWNGVKLMLHTRSPAGDQWTGLDDVHGTFDFKPLSRSVIVPADATEATLVVGLQDAGGAVWFDDVQLTVTGVPRTRPTTRPAFTVKPANLRGVMYGTKGREADLRELARWGANHIRWQIVDWELNKQPAGRDLDRYNRFIDESIAEIDKWLPLCEELGIKVLIDLHTPPGGLENGQHVMFADPKYQGAFIDAWDKLARHFKDRPAVWGYDLLNEPMEAAVPDNLMDWRQLAEHVAKRVRTVDRDRAIVIEPGTGGGWDNLDFFEPINLPNIVYSVHLYDPHLFTHQGVLDGMPVGVRYPGVINKVKWDRDHLRRILQPVRDYQLDYNVPFYIGEFSAIRWAPGDDAATYLADAIGIFEDYQWPWAYHAYREWHGWSVEHDGDRRNERPTTQPTRRKQILLDGFKRNLR